MHMIAKSCVLLLWLHLLTSVESKGKVFFFIINLMFYSEMILMINF